MATRDLNAELLYLIGQIQGVIDLCDKRLGRWLPVDKDHQADIEVIAGRLGRALVTLEMGMVPVADERARTHSPATGVNDPT